MAYYRKLEGKLCYLSPIDPKDYMTYTKWVNDLDTALGMLFLGSVLGEEKEAEVIERLKDGQNFAIVDSKSDRLIGNCGIPDANLKDRSCEVGIFIGEKEKRGKGYGTEAMKLLCDYAFNVLNMHRVFLRVYSFNKPAIRSYEKVGFRLAGRMREAKRIGGRWHDELLMDMLESEFESPVIAKAVSDRESSL
ncbi:MAG TPA: GNAT family protein [Bacillota bacterium]|nr:GNAT family N-acetyltransferase [Bacillota bacterium]HOA14931.1 GNAT family protein [Bacillota bacterium]